MGEHLAATADKPRPFSVAEFLPHWKNRLTNGWKQWVCSQTRRAMQVFEHGGSESELGGPSNAMVHSRHVSSVCCDVHCYRGCALLLHLGIMIWRTKSWMLLIRACSPMLSRQREMAQSSSHG